MDSSQYLGICVCSGSKDENIVILARSTKNYAVPSPNKKGGREAKIGFRAAEQCYYCKKYGKNFRELGKVADVYLVINNYIHITWL